MLQGIDPSGGARLPATRTASAPSPVRAAANPPAQAGVTASQDTVIVSITATVSQTDGTTGAPAASTEADQVAARGLEALQQMSQARSKAADTMKGFLRQKLDGLKKQLLLTRLLGTNALKIAGDSVKIAHEVAKTARDYAADTLQQTTTTSPITDQQAQQQADALKARAADAGATTAPTDPDDHFFYDAYQLLDVAKKTLVETQRIDVQHHGLTNAKAFKTWNRREAALEQAVTDAYKAMKTGGDLKAVDLALANDTGSSETGSPPS